MVINKSWNHQQPIPEAQKKFLQEIQYFLKVDRVNLYRFEANGSGQVVGEAVDRTQLPSFFNLYFPSQDVPIAVRERFEKKRMRMIVDTTTTHYSLQEPGKKIISDCYSADSCHIRYLKRLGVKSSLTLPILVRDQLWGLLIIHHTSYRHWSEAQLTMVELLVERLTLAITTEDLSQHHQELIKRENILTKIRDLLNSPTQKNIWYRVLEEVMVSFQGCGAKLYLNSQEDNPPESYHVGKQSHSSSLEDYFESQDFSATLVPDFPSEYFPLYHLDLNALPPSLEFIQQEFEGTEIASILIIALTSSTAEIGYLSIFRPIVENLQIWAGRPPEEEQPTQPRDSFEPWSEWTQTYLAWCDNDFKLAHAIAEKIHSAIRQQQLEETKENPFYDRLTQLPNRHLFSKQLNIALLEAKSTEELMAVIFFDIDRFEQVNKALGYKAGDLLLKLTAQRLQEVFSSANSTIAHWNGAKFICLIRHLSQNGLTIKKDCMTLAEAFRQPLEVKGETVYISASLGVAIAPYDGETPEILLLNAETAMYNAKRQGGNTFQFYTSDLESSLNPLSLEADLRKSLEKNQFRLDYQPQVDIRTGRVIAVEALIRWHHPERGLVSPGHFIPLAEETSLICEIGEWTLKEACKQHIQWRKLGLGDIRIAVNISTRQFQQTDFSKTVEKILEATQTPGSALEIEITETTAARDIPATTAILKELQTMGIKVALDDFGTGYSSLSAIKHFPINTLKIDRVFVRDMVNDSTDVAIAKAVIALGHGLNLTVLAEGVETLAQLELLQQFDCDQVQGYFFSEPLQVDAATAYLQINQGLVDLLSSRNSCLVRSSGSSSSLDAGKNADPQATFLDQLLQQPRREQIINQIAQDIQSSLDLKQILQTTVTQTRKFLDTDRVILYKFTPDWNGTVVVEAVGADWMSLEGEIIEDCCFQVKAALLYQKGRVSAIADIEQAYLAECHREMLAGYQVKANLVVPITNGDYLWGLLIAHHCRSTREWERGEIQLVKQLATQVAIAIHQAELYHQLEEANQQLQHLATHDGLTGLANRRYFDLSLAQEWRRLQLQQAPLSLILCDADFFKRYNDTYGHQAGDECLQKISQQMQAVTQGSGDFAARYGGEEFALVLPNTTTSSALEIAEILSEKIKELGILHATSPISPRLTLSCGVATIIPTQDNSPADLIKEADLALYQGKQKGRNCITIYSDLDSVL